MAKPVLLQRERRLIDELVNHYVNNQTRIKAFLDIVRNRLLEAIEDDQPLSKLVHSVKYRLKAPDHLRDKLQRIALKCRERRNSLNIIPDNLFLRINDLAGCRILHLHTRQMEQIHNGLYRVFDDARLELAEKPFAYVWDDEWREYFTGLGILAKPNPRLYSSVHYVVRPNKEAKVTCEIQVRTLADEIWGEIDHQLNYPHEHESLACRDQIKALARATSSCGRLVDSIIVSHEEWERYRSRRTSQRNPG
jgi:ppGpp synthetase/RelA/SpoT-type nucleotidyltranferase